MLSSFTLAVAALASFTLSRAEVTPTGPAPGVDFLEGGDCLITWTPSTTPDWKTAYIELMTGDNINMIHLTTVTTFDGTDPKGSFTWKCPVVTVHSAIYFYQFTSTGANSPQWTGRFSISKDGTTTPPANATQPNGDAKPWGVGALADPSTAVAAPPTSPEFSGSVTGGPTSTASGATSTTGTTTGTSTTTSQTSTSSAPVGAGSSGGATAPGGSTSGGSTTGGSTSGNTTTGGSGGNGAASAAALPLGLLVFAGLLATVAGL